jgi:hypothetical protein
VRGGGDCGGGGGSGDVDYYRRRASVGQRKPAVDRGRISVSELRRTKRARARVSVGRVSTGARASAHRLLVGAVS